MIGIYGYIFYKACITYHLNKINQYLSERYTKILIKRVHCSIWNESNNKTGTLKTTNTKTVAYPGIYIRDELIEISKQVSIKVNDNSVLPDDTIDITSENDGQHTGYQKLIFDYVYFDNDLEYDYGPYISIVLYDKDGYKPLDMNVNLTKVKSNNYN